MFPTPYQPDNSLVVADVVLASPATSLVIGGLDMLRDGDYCLISNAASTAAIMILLAQINGAATTYAGQYLRTISTTVECNALSTPYCGTFSTAFSSCTAHFSMANGLVSGVVSGFRSDGYQVFYEWRKTDVVSNVTSITLSADNPIIAGSRFTLYKRS